MRRAGSEEEMQQHATGIGSHPSPTHMPGGPVDLGVCGLISTVMGLISTKILEGGGGDVGPRQYACA